MSINSIRERGLFKKKDVSLHRLLTDTSQSDDEKEQSSHFKSELSSQMDPYSSRPTLQSNSVLKQLSSLENKINKQQAATKKYFAEMEHLEEHYKTFMEKQSQKCQEKKNQLLNRLNKQEERNKKVREKNQQLVHEIIDFISTRASSIQQANHQKEIDEKYLGHSNKHKDILSNRSSRAQIQNINPVYFGMHFLQAMKCELRNRKKKQITINGKDSNKNSQQNPTLRNEETFYLGIKAGNFQQRQSQSILLDNSFL